MNPVHEDSRASDRGRHGEFRRFAIAAAKVTGLIFGLAALVHISWNMFAPDMFGLEAIRMKQALGIVVFTGVLAAILGFGAGRKRGV